MNIRVLFDLLMQAAQACPDKIAVFHKNQTWTYGQIRDQVELLASALQKKGVAKGDRVSFFLEKRIEKIIAIFAIARAGGVFVPIRRLSLGSQAAHILSDSGSRILITTFNRIPLLAPHFKETPTLGHIIGIGSPDEAGDTAGHGIQLEEWSTVLNEESTSPLKPPYVVEPDLCAILYTSGSTGKPKGVVLSHLNVVSGAKIVSEFLNLTEKDRLLSILTFGFDYGLNQLTSAFLCRAQIVLLDYLFPKDIVATARKFECTGLAAVAATWIQLLQLPWSQSDMPQLRYVTNSGGAIPEPYVRDLRKRLSTAEVFLMYGLTEAFRSTFLNPSLVDQFPTSMGKAIPGEEILILGPDNKPVKPGEVGELVHRGVLVAQGYWNAPELTAIRYRNNPLQSPEVPLPEKVVYSGDKVRIDENGLLYFVGRDDEMIKCAGNRLSPTEVEDILYASEAIQAAVALGIPHAIYGQSVLVVIAPKDNATFSLDVLKSYCTQRMPAYMLPSHYEVWDTIPHNANGKLDRALVKKQVYEKLGIQGK